MFNTRIVHDKYMMFKVDSVEMSGESPSDWLYLARHGNRNFYVHSCTWSVIIEYSIFTETTFRQAESIWNSHQIDRYLNESCVHAYTFKK